MNKSDLIEAVSRKGRIPAKKADEVVNLIFDSLAEALTQGEKVEIRGFGSITIREYEARTGRNPKTGELIDVRPKKSPFFKVGKELRERLAK